MSDRWPSTSPLEAAVAKLRKRERSPWGRLQNRGNLWLARIESHPFFQSYAKLRRQRHGAISLRAEPAIDLDSLLVFSLLFHLLLIFLLARLSFTPPVVNREAPVMVRILELGEPTQETKKESPKPKPVSRPRPRPPTAPAKSEEISPPVPAVKPALPGPKVLALAPRENVANSAPQSAEALVQLPTRQPEAGQPSIATRVDALPGLPAEQVSPLPETLRRGEKAQSASPGSPASLSSLSSPDFAPYLEMIKKRVQSVWKYPEGISGVHRVNILFVLDRGGKLVRAEVLDSTDPRLNGSAVQAMKTASPFPPVPESLKDLAGWPLRMRFSVDFGIKASR